MGDVSSQVREKKDGPRRAARTCQHGYGVSPLGRKGGMSEKSGVVGYSRDRSARGVDAMRCAGTVGRREGKETRGRFASLVEGDEVDREVGRSAW